MNPTGSKSFVEFESRKPNTEFENVYDVVAEELAKRVSDVVLIDVRQPDEFTGELGHIETAKLIVLNTLPDQLAQIPTDKTVVFVCRSGGRSARATAFAIENGYQHVFNLKGGMLRWNELGLPLAK